MYVKRRVRLQCVIEALPDFRIGEPPVLPTKMQSFFSARLALCFVEMLFGILLTCLRKCQRRGSNWDMTGPTNFCRLSNLLAYFLPLIVFVFFNRVLKSYTLPKC